MVALQSGDEPRPSWRESHERRSSVGRMRLACDEAVFDERVDESRHRPWRHLQRVGQDTLGHRPAQAQLPKQVRTGRRELQRLDCLRHVVVQQDDKFEHAVEDVF